MQTRDLKYWYNKFNKKFFSNKLPDVWVHFARTGRGKRSNRYSLLGQTYFSNKWEPYEIRIHHKLYNKPLFETLCIKTLLHEMAHVSVGGKFRHGPEFKKEIDRLYKAGAYTKTNGGIL